MYTLSAIHGFATGKMCGTVNEFELHVLRRRPKMARFADG
jgi:hypothetical protein